MALGCVRVDLTVRLRREVEGFDSTVAFILSVALHVSIRATVVCAQAVHSKRVPSGTSCSGMQSVTWPLAL